MKKSLLLIISIITLILSILNGWFSDYLFDKFFILSLILDIILFVLNIFCIIKNIDNYKYNKEIIYLTGCFICIFSFIITLFFPFREVRTKIELSLYDKQRNEVINLVKNKNLIPDEFGNVRLPSHLKKTSISGEISVYQNDKKGIEIGFWIFRGMQSGSVELIYSSDGEKLIKKNKTGHPITQIKKLKDNWYYVITDY